MLITDLIEDETRDIRSNIILCLKELPRAKAEGTSEGKGLYLTVYSKLSPNRGKPGVSTIFAKPDLRLK